MHFSNKRITDTIKNKFQGIILSFYRRHGRDLPWRTTSDPYRILVSEVMLQQTQVDRVVPKYLAFLEKFPDPAALARASKRQVLACWQGLGYNRRALSLLKCAAEVQTRFEGRMPRSYEELLQLPGIGPYTASAICVFAYNRPRIFIETNIRSVYIHFFFEAAYTVSDSEILPLVEQTLYERNPRRWYNALMDYGVHLKKTLDNPSRKSIHHTRQSRFEGSDRQIRGRILKVLVGVPRMKQQDLVRTAGDEPERVKKILFQLEQEGFLRMAKGYVSLA